MINTILNFLVFPKSNQILKNVSLDLFIKIRLWYHIQKVIFVKDVVLYHFIDPESPSLPKIFKIRFTGGAKEIVVNRFIKANVSGY